MEVLVLMGLWTQLGVIGKLERMSTLSFSKAKKMGKRKAFTLVELLVVIAIIALLMAILLPTLSRAKKQAKSASCQMRLRQWGVVFQMFAGDNNGFFPANYDPGPNQQEAFWIVGTLPYAQDKDLRICPMAAKSTNPVPCNRCPGTTYSAWGPFDPGSGDDWWSEFDAGSYGINEAIANPPPDIDSIWGILPVKYIWRSPNVKQAGRIPVLADCLYTDAVVLHIDEPPPFPDQYDSWANNGIKMFCINRHDGGINVLFADFHVEKVGLKGLWKLKWHRKFDTNWPEPDWESEAPWMAGFKSY
jgi:prepilin-type N-terminal cleavage/methylation domain-containing protein/prepilin-type processing-associated H-X9-DG protein